MTDNERYELADMIQRAHSIAFRAQSLMIDLTVLESYADKLNKLLIESGEPQKEGKNANRNSGLHR